MVSDELLGERDGRPAVIFAGWRNRDVDVLAGRGQDVDQPTGRRDIGAIADQGSDVRLLEFIPPIVLTGAPNG